MKRDELLSVIRQALIDKTINDSDWTREKENASLFWKEQERKQEQAKKEHERFVANRRLPENYIPKMMRERHVPQNCADGNNYLNSYLIKPLKKYGAELANGQHQGDFRKGDNIQALILIKEAIARREHTDTKNEIRKAKAASEVAVDELMTLRRETHELKMQLDTATQTDTQKKPVDYSR